MPAESWRTIPARKSSLCETTSASAGSSRSVGTKYCDQRMVKHSRLAVRMNATDRRLEYRLQSGHSVGPSGVHPLSKARLKSVLYTLLWYRCDYTTRDVPSPCKSFFKKRVLQNENSNR